MVSDRALALATVGWGIRQLITIGSAALIEAAMVSLRRDWIEIRWRYGNGVPVRARGVEWSGEIALECEVGGKWRLGWAGAQIRNALDDLDCKRDYCA
jgi:hypothetical protein